MATVGLPTGTWIATAIIAALAVLACLDHLAGVVDYEKRFRELVRQVRALRATPGGGPAARLLRSGGRAARRPQALAPKAGRRSRAA